MNKKITQKNDKKIHLEAKTFNEKYDVYATDQITVRRILTPYNMQRLEEIAEKMHARAEIIIKNSDIYMKMEYTNFLDFYTKNQSINQERVNRDYTLLKYILEIFDTIATNIEKIEVE